MNFSNMEEDRALVQDALSGLDADVHLQAGQKHAVRMLVSNLAAGVIIGRQGTNRSEIQAASSARLQLSRPNEFCPGTTDRVLLVTGSLDSVMTAVHLVLNKLATSVVEEPGSFDQAAVDLGQNGAPATQVKLLLPAAMCGIIIGRAGETIKAIIAETACNISLSPQERARPTLDYDRIVTISGTMRGALRAVALVCSKLANSPQFAALAHMNLAMPGTGFSSALAAAAAAAAAGGGFSPSSTAALLGASTPTASGILANLGGSSLPTVLHVPAAQLASLPQPLQLSGGPGGGSSKHLLQTSGLISGLSSLSLAGGPGSNGAGGSLAALPSTTLLTAAGPGGVGSLGPVLQGGSGGLMGMLAGSVGPQVSGQRVETSIMVPAYQVGAVMGRAGSTLQSIKALLNVKIVISDRLEGDQTGFRQIHIYGAPDAVAMAQQIVLQKIQEAPQYLAAGYVPGRLI